MNEATVILACCGTLGLAVLSHEQRNTPLSTVLSLLAGWSFAGLL